MNHDLSKLVKKGSGTTDQFVKKYLDLLNLPEKEFWSRTDIPITITRYIILFAIRDYFEEKITLYDLSGVAGIYWVDTNRWNPLNGCSRHQTW